MSPPSDVHQSMLYISKVQPQPSSQKSQSAVGVCVAISMDEVGVLLVLVGVLELVVLYKPNMELRSDIPSDHMDDRSSGDVSPVGNASSANAVSSKIV